MTEPSPAKSTFELIRQAVASVHSTEHFSAQEVLARYPELRNNHSALVDLAYEEYCQAKDRGDTIDQKRFAAQFPEIEKSLLELLEVHSFVVGNSLLSLEEPEVRWPIASEAFLGFELLEEIGRGAFARVFLAREIGVGNRQVVVKISQRGAAEASLLGLLDHPNIVAIHSVSFDEVRRLSALCMPYLGRTTANQWIETRFKARSRHFVNSPRHLRSVIEIGKGVCQGLQFAHERQVLHCDVKPSNILITHDGEPVLLDFNLSTDQTSEKHLVGGTLMYMAPEQLQRASGDAAVQITAATDVFCLAATLYQMATGQPAFPLNPDSNARLKEVLRTSLDLRQDFEEQNHPLADPLLSVLKKALAFDPKDRTATAAEFYDRLVACEKKLAPSKRNWLWPAAAVLGLAASAFAAKTWLFDPPPSVAEKTPPADSKTGSDDKTPGDGPITKQEGVPNSLEELLKRAEEAEFRENFAEAAGWYEDVLDSQDPKFDPAERNSVEHSLAFCRLLTGKFHEANRDLETLNQAGIDDATFSLNVAGGLLIEAFEDNPPNITLIRKSMLRLRKVHGSVGENASLRHVLSILYVFLAKDEVGSRRATNIEIALSHARMARQFGISENKTLAIGHLLPELNQSEPLASLKENRADQTPDRSFNVVLRSPQTNEIHFVTLTLP